MRLSSKGGCSLALVPQYQKCGFEPLRHSLPLYAVTISPTIEKFLTYQKSALYYYAALMVLRTLRVLRPLDVFIIPYFAFLSIGF